MGPTYNKNRLWVITWRIYSIKYHFLWKQI